MTLPKVIAIDGAKITIMPKHDDLKDPLEFQSNELKKYFRQVLPAGAGADVGTVGES